MSTAGVSAHGAAAGPPVLAVSVKHLLTLFGGEHSLGGIAGDGLAETTDENPARVALVQLAVAFAVRHPSVTSASRRRQAAHPQEEQ